MKLVGFASNNKRVEHFGTTGVKNTVNKNKQEVGPFGPVFYELDDTGEDLMNIYCEIDWRVPNFAACKKFAWGDTSSSESEQFESDLDEGWPSLGVDRTFPRKLRNRQRCAVSKCKG